MSINSRFGFGSSTDGQTQPGESAMSVQGFDDLVNMLKSSTSDAQTIEIASSMGQVATMVEQIAPKLHSTGDAKVIGPLLVELMSALRKHRQVVSNLSGSWRELPEHANYLVSLGNFRLLLNQWLMERAVEKDKAASLDEFESLAWRTLGDGMLLMDVHEQLRRKAIADSEQRASDGSKPDKAETWWNKLRG
jgi:hypothetical protein